MEKESTYPLYEQIVQEMRRRIEGGTYSPGARLPGHIKLAKEFGVSSITANRALQELTREGLIERRERAGSYVASRTLLSSMTLLMPFAVEGADSHYFGYMQGCLERARELNIDTRILTVEHILEMAGSRMKEHLGEGVVHVGLIDKHLAAAINRYGRPTVQVGVVTGEGKYFVSEDRLACTRELVQTLIKDGYRRIGFIGNLEYVNHRICRDGYLEGVAELGLGHRLIRDATRKFSAVMEDLMAEDLAVDAVVVSGAKLPILVLPTILSKRSLVRLACIHESSAVMQLGSIAYIGRISQVESGKKAVDLLIDVISGKVREPTIRLGSYEILRPTS